MLTARSLSSTLALAACASLPALATAAPVSPIVRWLPRAWTPPVAAECPAPTEDVGLLPVSARSVDGEPQSLPDARAAERAAIRIRTRPDGSRYAIVGGAFRSYTFATFDADGSMRVSCVDSRSEALRRAAQANTESTAPVAARKEK